MQDKVHFLDTSFVSALLNRADHFHREALDAYEQGGEDTTFLISPVVVAELVLLTQRVPHLTWRILGDVLSLFDIEVVGFADDFAEEFAHFVSKTNYNLKPNDYSILFSSQQLDARLLTFDEDLQAVLKQQKS